MTDNTKNHHERRYDLDFSFPETPFKIVLVEPEIPQNTGNIARLSAATGSELHLIEPLGFHLTDRSLKRAGLDYWEGVDMTRHSDYSKFLSGDAAKSSTNIWLFSTAGTKSHFDVDFLPGDALVFGSESHGLNDEILAMNLENIVQIPMINDKVRSLNLANSVSIALYEALRQAFGKSLTKT